MLLLPFDAHNHIHLGRTAATDALPGLGGMAIMATHPRDFDRVLELSRTLPVASCRQDDDDVVVVPCLGVHPWFVVELSAADWALTDPHDNDGTDGSNDLLPTWLVQLETLLVQHPRATVGEIGLDGFRFDAATQQLVCPMERQVTALRLQLELAARLQRPVSIHVVQAFGPLMTCLADLKKKKKHGPVLPPRLYFHAFGGKLGTVDQLLALCGREPGQVYFGFAPLVNFRSHKTAAVMQKVGLERLVLETDHEEASRVPQSMQEGIAFVAETFGVDARVVVERTTQNARDLYGLSQSDGLPSTL